MRIKGKLCFSVGGLEEVFAAVGESVSLACRTTSSLSFRGNTEWTVKQKTLAKAFYTSEDSSLVIDKLSAQQAGDYQCAESSGQRNVFNKVRLHTLDGKCVNFRTNPETRFLDITPLLSLFIVTARRENLTLTCVLTCAEECEESFNLTWSAAGKSRSMKVNNTLIHELILPVWPKSSDEISCSVYRESSLMASKTWRSDTCMFVCLYNL